MCLILSACNKSFDYSVDEIMASTPVHQFVPKLLQSNENQVDDWVSIDDRWTPHADNMFHYFGIEVNKSSIRSIGDYTAITYRQFRDGSKIEYKFNTIIIETEGCHNSQKENWYKVIRDTGQLQTEESGFRRSSGYIVDAGIASYLCDAIYKEKA